MWARKLYLEKKTFVYCGWFREQFDQKPDIVCSAVVV